MTRFVFVARLRSLEGSIDTAELVIIQTAEYKGKRLRKLSHVPHTYGKQTKSRH